LTPERAVMWRFMAASFEAEKDYDGHMDRLYPDIPLFITILREQQHEEFVMRQLLCIAPLLDVDEAGRRMLAGLLGDMVWSCAFY
jgi:hypothetical protein